MSYEGLKSLFSDIALELPRAMRFGLADPKTEAHDLYPVEEAAVSHSVDARRREFAAGRRAARQAMNALGHDDKPIPAGADRAPIWPKEMTGSITHTDFAAVSVVMPRGKAQAVGIDLEYDAPLEDALVDEICAPQERYLANSEQLAARRVFSAKEAAYKAQFPLTHTIFGFDGLRLEGDKSQHAARFTNDVPPFRRGDTLKVQQWCGYGVILSLVLVPAPSLGLQRGIA